MLKRNNIKKMVDYFEVTIVILVWNSDKWLPACLSALLCQTYMNFTVLLVGGRCRSVRAIFFRVKNGVFCRYVGRNYLLSEA